MGVVLLGHDPKLERRVAIKTFDGGDAPNEEEWQWLRDRLLAEGTRAGSLDHPNIVKVFDVVDDRDSASIVMEYVPGSTMDEYIRTHGSPSTETALRWLRQTADALDYAHSKGIVHRDIKPGNLMIDDDGNVKITDFGIAKRVGTSTQTSRQMGTPEFMAPEQFEANAEIDGRADQFALATLAYLLLTGRKAFSSETLGSLSRQIIAADPEPASHANPQLSRKVDAVFRKAMAKSAAGRYPNCLDFVADLEHTAYAGPVDGRPTNLVPILITGIVLVALVGVAIYIYMKGSSLTSPVTVSISAEPQEVQAGGETMLHWSSENATRVEIATLGGVGLTGSRAVTPDKTIIYDITAYGKKENATAHVSVTVLPPHTDDGDRSGTGRGGPPPPPPPPPPPSFTLAIQSRGFPVRSGLTFSDDDPNLGDPGPRQLTCTVHGKGSIPKKTALHLTWYLNGEEMADHPVSVSDLERPIPYGNKAESGKYRVRLSGRGVSVETSFTITKGAG
jgi:serine/threonine protein kinase